MNVLQEYGSDIKEELGKPAAVCVLTFLTICCIATTVLLCILVFLTWPFSLWVLAGIAGIAWFWRKVL